MYCNQCGAALPPGAQQCPQCGRVVAGAGASPAPGVTSAGRVARHRKALGVLWLVRALMLIPGGLFLLWMSSAREWAMSGMWGAPWTNWPPFAGEALHIIGIGVLIMGVLAAVTGVALLQPQPWARMLAIVLGIVELVSVPFGTALGIYTLWVLMPNTSEAEFNRIAAARGAL